MRFSNFTGNTIWKPGVRNEGFNRKFNFTNLNKLTDKKVIVTIRIIV